MWSRILPPLFLFLVTFSFYLHNLSPSVYGGDVGDMLNAIATRGIPHPSGYPLFTLLGILFGFLPISQTLAWKVGLLSALASSLAVVLFYFTSYKLLKRRLPAFIAAFTLAFYYTFWLYAEVAEVFALAIFFILLLFFLAILYIQKKKIIFLYLLFFFAGLAVGHHEIIILFFPSLALLVLRTNWRIFLKPFLIIKCFLLFILGFFPYIYVPLAALSSPPINWMGQATVENFTRFILRLDYGWHLSQSGGPYLWLLGIKTYVLDLLIKLTPAGIILILLGMIHLIKRKQIVLFLSLFIGFFLSGPFVVVYGFTPLVSAFKMGVLERFYMLSALPLLFFLPFGIVWIAELAFSFLKRISATFSKKSYYKELFMGVFFLLPAILFISNFPKTDLHDVWLGDYLGEDILSPLPQNSVVFLSGDTMLFNTLYVKYGRGMRQDVNVINLHGAGRDPFFVKKKQEIIAKTPKIKKDSAILQTLSLLAKENSVFSIAPLDDMSKISKDVEWIPYGLVFKFATDYEKKMPKEIFLAQQENIFKKLHIPDAKSRLKLSTGGLSISEIPIIYAQAYTNTANYLITKYDDLETARMYYQRAIDLAPSDEGGYKGLGYYYLSKNECRKAASLFDKTILFNPGNKTAYAFLYLTYSICQKDTQKATQVEKQFKDLFRMSIFSQIAEDLKK